MDKCLDTSLLIKWLNGSLGEDQTIEFGEHIESCEQCRQRIDELTDDPSINLPSDPASLLPGSTFTDEPHFRSMRQKLGEKVSDLNEFSRNRNPEEGEGQASGIQNQLDEVVVEGSIETIEQNAASTLTLDTREPERSTDISFTVDGYHLEGLIGRGGFADVYQAWDKRLERNVAIKVLDQSRLNPRNRHRFLRESKSASSLESPHVVRVFTSGESSGRPFIVMELIQGQTLAAWIEQASSQKKIDTQTIEQGVKFLIQICEGVQAVHNAGLVHRDIKPSNIFIDPANNTAKLGDFGLARVLDQDTVTLTRAAELAGTPAYMSPEQTVPQGEVAPASDVYALGATLYHILSGQPPFRGSSLAILKQVNDAQPPSPRQLNESVSRDLETICLKALEKDPRRRYASSQGLAEDLQKAIDGKPITARPLTKLQKLGRWAKSNAGLATALGLLFVTLLTGTIVSTTLWLRADSAEARAVTDRTAVLNSLTNLVDSLYEELSDNAASIKARESVLEAAIDGLNSITQIRSDDVADRTAMLAYRQLGNLMNLKGASEEAEKHYQTALDVARKFDKRDHNVQSGCDLARSIGDLATHYQQIDQQSELVAELISESNGILNEILVEEPENESALIQLIENHVVHLDTFKSQRAQDQVIAESARILEDLERLQSLRGSNHAVSKAAQRLHFLIGRAYFDVGNLGMAQRQFELAQANLSRALTATPNSSKLVEVSSSLNRADALVASAMGRHTESTELFVKSLDDFQRLAAADPDDVSLTQQVANTYSLMSNPLHASANHAEAVRSLHLACEIYQEILEQSPQDNLLRGLVAEAFFKKANNEMYLFEWDHARNSYKKVVHYLSAPELGEPLRGAASMFQLELSNLSINAIGLLTGKKWATLDAASESLALLHLARMDASTSTVEELSESALATIMNISPEIDATTFDELFQYVKSLRDMPQTMFVYRMQFEARVLGLMARNIADDSDDVERRNALLSKSIAILKILACSYPKQNPN